ncbi:hypothetical protein [Nocardiopsis suaedae]|uniref:Uncharacterized protein n=1 Tax=Nocardiopsis suaedae TaxID=3018444 RepID=A0ABT4THD2_9ACTN|nr:hypothetical protein [Nocardiopsis suaedae]MDA2804123.1 hypothetical protein [Nocardiopsis suaedae]
MDTPRTPYRDTDPETIQAVFASYGRMVLGAPPPEGSVTIEASDVDDFRRQWHALFDDEGGEDAGGAPDHPGTTGA